MKKCLDDRLSHLFDDPYLSPYLNALKRRREKTETTKARLVSGNTNLIDFASGHEYFGLHACENGWLFREWAPNASDI
ncbi:MAG: 1,4-alpha-glucan-branching enzyme, partial [Lentisphaerae bacterium]|nr:1,4-alpha-glucan-branching enzyme [Lentisphaerota bacterium]